jgi:hypothetical protein
MVVRVESSVLYEQYFLLSKAEFSIHELSYGIGK